MVNGSFDPIEVESSINGKFKFGCPLKFCGKEMEGNSKSTVRTNMKRHIQLHTGEKPFKCQLCSYAHNQKVHLQKHMKTNHGILVEKVEYFYRQ